jgi:hypothetical protein
VRAPHSAAARHRERRRRHGASPSLPQMVLGLPPAEVVGGRAPNGRSCLLLRPAPSSSCAHGRLAGHDRARLVVVRLVGRLARPATPGGSSPCVLGIQLAVRFRTYRRSTGVV